MFPRTRNSSIQQAAPAVRPFRLRARYSCQSRGGTSGAGARRGFGCAFKPSALSSKTRSWLAAGAGDPPPAEAEAEAKAQAQAQRSGRRIGARGPVRPLRCAALSLALGEGLFQKGEVTAGRLDWLRPRAFRGASFSQPT